VKDAATRRCVCPEARPVWDDQAHRCAECSAAPAASDPAICRCSPGADRTSWRGTGDVVAPGRNNHDYRFFDVDFTALAPGTTLTFEVTAGSGASNVSVDLFRPGANVLPVGQQTDHLCWFYDQARASTRSGPCTIPSPGTYRVGMEGNWFSDAGATNTVSFRFGCQ